MFIVSGQPQALPRIKLRRRHSQRKCRLQTSSALFSGKEMRWLETYCFPVLVGKELECAYYARMRGWAVRFLWLETGYFLVLFQYFVSNISAVKVIGEPRFPLSHCFSHDWPTWAVISRAWLTSAAFFNTFIKAKTGLNLMRTSTT